MYLPTSSTYTLAKLTHPRFRPPTALSNEQSRITKPALFVAAARDPLCLAAFGKEHMQQYVPHADIVELDTGHWTTLEKSEELNEILDKWLEKLS